MVLDDIQCALLTPDKILFVFVILYSLSMSFSQHSLFKGHICLRYFPWTETGASLEVHAFVKLPSMNHNDPQFLNRQVCTNSVDP